MIVLDPAPGQSKTFEALRAFLIAILPPDVEVFQAQGNNVPEPVGDRFVIMTPVTRAPLSTNINVYADAAFDGYTSGATLHVSTVLFGAVKVGHELFGPGILAGTKIVRDAGGGDFEISNEQTTPTARLAAGVKSIIQPAQRTIQLDVHAADLEAAGDMAQRICSLFRDELAGDLMTAVDPGVSPLYADDARQMPFVNAEQKYESRWVVDAVMQVNEAVEVSQQFADTVKINIHPII